MERFEAAAAGVVRGQRVRVNVVSHEPWGMMVTVRGHEGIGASVDAALIDSPSGSPRALPDEYPPIGVEIDAVVTEVDRYNPPVWIRLSAAATHVEALGVNCGFCGERAVITPGGDGVTIDVKSTDGPGCASIAVHRACLVDLLHPNATGDAARVANVGRPT
jgi:hypothetical protein